MRKLLLLILLTLTVATSFGQFGCGPGQVEGMDFDTEFIWSDWLLQIDTVSNPNNIWQVGSPQKNIISSANTSPYAIITDTVNYYPPNDTSVFKFIEIDQAGFAEQHTVEIYGFYNVNSDSLNDYGTIEISLDFGSTWINLITDTIYSDYYSWVTPKPTLTGNSNGWQNFWVSVAQLATPFPIDMGDTILWKFTFISDSIADTLDGLAYDSFQFCNGSEAIDEMQNDNLISVFPNPTSDLLYIERKTQPKNELLQLYNYNGQLLFDDNNFNSKYIDIGRLTLTDGLYFIKYSDTKSYAIKRFIVQH